MNALETVLEWRATAAIGWALLQFAWQGAAIALLVAVALRVLRSGDPRQRYVVCVGAMGLMFLALASTVVVVLRAPAASTGNMVLPRMWASVTFGANAAAWLPSVLPWTTIAWILGALIQQLRLVAQWRYTQTLIRYLLPADAPLQRMISALRHQLGIERAVRVAYTTLLQVPAVIGWFRPIVLVPLGAADTITLRQLRAIVAHELAHVQRNDQVVNWIQGLFESLFFFHPAAWWLSRQIRVEREFCCDDVAVAACGDALSYARALSKLEDARTLRPQVALASTGGSLMMRITRLFSGRAPRGLNRWSLIALPGMLLGLVLFAANCTETPVESRGSVTNATASETGADRGPIVGFERDPDMPRQEALAVGRRHIQELLNEGKITHEEARRNTKALEEHVHAATGPEPADIEAHEKLTTAETHQILENCRDAEGNFILDHPTLAKLTPKQVAALREFATAHQERIEIREDAPPDP